MTVKEYNRSVEEYADAVYRFIRSNLRDSHRANDIVQDSFEKLWMHVGEIEFRVAKSWLFTTAYHLMVDIIRREKVVFDLDLVKNEDILQQSCYSDLNEILHEALGRLSEIQRTSILLRDYEGYNYQEIGQITNQSEAQVKINIYRGRIALKNYIGKIETILES
jgi:RNA polymerase sigma-70 factor (ECF subfamily)